MSTFKSEQQHKANLRALGRLAALVVVYFIAVFAAIGINVQTMPQIPWFLAVIAVGGYLIVPRVRRVMKQFEENAKG